MSYFYGPDLDCNDSLLSRHSYGIFVLSGFSVALKDNRSFMEGSDDMSSLGIIGGLLWGVIGTYICFLV